MRRSLLAVPVVLALGAGGYLIFHGGSPATTAPAAPPAHPATTVTTRDGRVIDLATVHSGVAAPAQASAGAPSDPTATAAAGSAESPSATAPSATATTTASGSAAASAGGLPPVMPAGDVARFEQTHGRGATNPMPVPVRGSQVLQKHLGAMAKCQGPEYATLTGQARVDYANRCAKAGVTLPP